jgi:hypothetical protein
MIHFYDCEFSDLGVQFASPHSFRSVRNSRTSGKHLFARYANTIFANSQTQFDLRHTELAEELVRLNFSSRAGSSIEHSSANRNRPLMAISAEAPE